MEIAFLVIAVIGLLALTGSAQAQSVSPQAVSYQPPPTPWRPSLPSSTGAPMVPSTGANVSGQLFSGAAQIGTQVGTQAVKASGAVAGLGLTAATAGIGAAVGIVVSVAAALLKAHQARLKGAKNENQALDMYIPVFDSFVSQLAQAYNSRQTTAADAAAAAQQFDRSLYNSLRALTGGPGTAWNDVTGMAGKCDKGCTASCCIYFGALGPVLNDISSVLGFPTGKWGGSDSGRISGRTITAPKIFPSKYSSFTREAYTLNLN